MKEGKRKEKGRGMGDDVRSSGSHLTEKTWACGTLLCWGSLGCWRAGLRGWHSCCCGGTGLLALNWCWLCGCGGWTARASSSTSRLTCHCRLC